MKIRKFVCLLCALAFALCLPLFGCAGKTKKFRDDGTLHIIDDNNRNWYEVFVRSFCDSDDDGIGDLNGVTEKLDYIADMGFNGIWLMPICESNTYHGYDVKDYKTVESDYGTNADCKALIAAAHEKGIRVIVDMVFNHTATAHSWFQRAVSALKNGGTGENAKYIGYYNFSDSRLSGYAPVSGVANTYYECQFDTAMPDLNLDNADVRAELTDIMEFWLTDMDADGFRLDACTSYYTGSVDRNVEFLSFVNTAAKEIKEDAYIVGEVWLGTDAQIRAYYESGIDSCFLFTVSAGAAYGGELKPAFSSLQDAPGKYYTDLLLQYQQIYDKGTLAPFLGNHDTARAANMFQGEAQVKMGAGLMGMMNGNIFVYYGDEIGMICADANSDPTKRIPMRWGDDDIFEGQVRVPPAAGVTIDASAYRYPSVQTQEADEFSILNYYKALMRIRNRHPEIARGTIEALASGDPYVAAFTKTYQGSSVTVLVNLSESNTAKVDLSSFSGKLSDVLDASKNYTQCSGNTLTMQPYSIAVLA